MDKKITKTKDAPKKPSAFAKVMKRIFVHNIGYKALAIALSVAIWVLTTGLA